MKVIIIYSGKGGVGKTTTTANLARVLESQGQRVFVLDGDVNTPSMNNIFPEKDPSENLHIESLGYETQRMIYIQQSMIRSYIRSAIRKINEFNPDYVLIDTPPSITDVHINLIESIKVSGIVMVTQPNAMSRQDVMRTHLFFQSKGVQTIGIIENMVEVEDTTEYPWPVLGKIKFIAGFDFNKVFESCKTVYQSIAEKFENLEAVLLEIKKRTFTDESISIDDMEDLYGSEMGSMKIKDKPKFVNLATWDFVRDRLSDMENCMGAHDMFLSVNDTPTIKRVLEAFTEDDQAYFMVIKAPTCEIKVLPGEIGQGTLFFADSYYGVPRVKYQTAKGDITLFPHEIKPATPEEMALTIFEGGTITKDGRYIPAKEIMRELYYTFGDRVGLGENWETHYDEIVNSNNVNNEKEIVS